MEEKQCYWVTCVDVVSGLVCNESSPLPSELGHQWSSGQPQLFELQWGCQSPQSHILRRQAAQLGKYYISSTNNGWASVLCGLTYASVWWMVMGSVFINGYNMLLYQAIISFSVLQCDFTVCLYALLHYTGLFNCVYLCVLCVCLEVEVEKRWGCRYQCDVHGSGQLFVLGATNRVNLQSLTSTAAAIFNLFKLNDGEYVRALSAEKWVTLVLKV